MMNDSRHEARVWWMLAATAPALVAVDLQSGIALGAVACITIAVLSAIHRATANLTPTPRQTLLLIAAATLAAAGDMALQAFAWQALDTVRAWLPLIAVTAAVQVCCVKPGQQRDDREPRMIRTGTLALVAPIFVGGLRQWTEFPFALLSAAPLLLSALAIAAKNQWGRRPDAGAGGSPQARRVRVTGPVS